MNDIKIFVSHRVDLQSELIDNPLYIPVKCGAVYNKNRNSSLIGDNTGDNISEKRLKFCELTVQYWAWKNVDADYYGLCHYRRFLSFSEKHYTTNPHGMIRRTVLSEHAKKTFELTNEDRIREVVKSNDFVVSEYAEVGRIPTPTGIKKSVLEMWHGHDSFFFGSSTINLMFDLIERFSPEYLESAKEYFSGHLHRGFNCYIMKKCLFLRLCEFQFPILFELEKLVDSDEFPRTIGYVGEMLYGIFVFHITTHESYKYKELQLVFFEDARVVKGSFDVLCRYFRYYSDKILRIIVSPILPLHSKRREAVKNFLRTFKVLK